jgi:hypothetical protein
MTPAPALTARALTAALAAAPVGAVAQDSVRATPGTLGTCAVVATCTDAFDTASCAPADGPQRTFVTRVGGQPVTWVETDYSRFPQSDTNETQGFLPVTMLPPGDPPARIAALAAGTEVLLQGVGGLVFGQALRSAGPATHDLWQFNPRGLVRRWQVACPPGEM